MDINFGPKKVWNDLIESKENLRYLGYITILLVVLSGFDAASKTKILSPIADFILYGYFALMANNIIHGKTPVLENLEQSEDEKRNLFIVALKMFGIGVIYGLSLCVIGVLLFLLFAKVLMLSAQISTIILVLCLLPMLVVVSISNLLFSENLNFKDAFNIKKAIMSLKAAWGKYLTVWAINLLVIIVLFSLLMLILVPACISLILLFKIFPIFAITKEAGKLIGEILSSSFGEVIAVVITYWYTNASAQVYKYSLSKMYM